MGFLFVLGQFYSHVYASATAIIAAALLADLEMIRGKSMDLK